MRSRLHRTFLFLALTGALAYAAATSVRCWRIEGRLARQTGFLEEQIGVIERWHDSNGRYPESLAEVEELASWPAGWPDDFFELDENGVELWRGVAYAHDSRGEFTLWFQTEGGCGTSVRHAWHSERGFWTHFDARW